MVVRPQSSLTKIGIRIVYCSDDLMSNIKLSSTSNRVNLLFSIPPKIHFSYVKYLNPIIRKKQRRNKWFKEERNGKRGKKVKSHNLQKRYLHNIFFYVATYAIISPKKMNLNKESNLVNIL